METLANSQIEKLLEDIPSIKPIISQNKRVIRQILSPTHFKWASLLLGFSLMGFSIALYLLDVTFHK